MCLTHGPKKAPGLGYLTMSVQQMANTSWGDKTAQSAWSRIPGLFRGCLHVLGSPSSTAGIVSVLLSTSLNQNWESWGKPLTECFLSSWGMFTEVWCFSKPLIRSTPCPPYLYFSKCVERTLCFCFLPGFQNILVAVNSMASSEGGQHGQSSVLHCYVQVFQIRET